MSRGMDVADVDLAWAERDAEPERFRTYDYDDHLPGTYERVHSEREAREATRSRRTSYRPRPSTQSRGEPVEGAEAEEVEEPEEREEVESPIAHRDGPHGTPNETGSVSSSVSSVRREELRGQSGGTRSRQMSNALTISKTSTKMERMLMEYLDRHPTAVERMEAHRLQHMQTVGSKKQLDEGVELPDFGGGKVFPPPLPEREQYVVEFSGQDDPRHGQNFPFKKKVVISAILIFYSLSATFASSIFSPGSEKVGKEFHVGMEVTTLGTSLFVLGYAVGPVVFAPISELYGRRLPIIVGAFGFSIFNTAVAVAKDYQTLIISRFFSAFFGSSPLTLCGAVFADIYNNETRGTAVAIFAATLMNGPFCGPFVGGFLVKTIGWRWTAWIPAFMGYTSMVLAVFFQDETYGPVILVAKAAELRRLTRNWGIHAKQEEVEVDLKELAINNITRPLRILFTEPIVLVVTLYMSFIYGLLYLNLTAYALVFEGVYHWHLGEAGLPYVALIVGVGIGLIILLLSNKSYVKKLRANNGIPVPEWRLPLPMAGGIVFACGLFWFGWGGYMASTPWIVPALAGIFIGFGIYSVFLQCLNYIIDAYLMFSASAIAANTIMRSLFGAVFPLFAEYMFNGIGIEWGMTLLGCVAALFIPMPFWLHRYGKGLRGKSKFAPAPDIAQEKRKDEESRGQSENEGEAGAGGSSGSDDKNESEKKDE